MPNDRSIPRFTPVKCRHGWTTCVYCGQYDPAMQMRGVIAAATAEEVNLKMVAGISWSEPQMEDASAKPDPVNHPAHYTSHPSGIECITITRHMSFNLGNAVKYIWRAQGKGKTVEDLRKAIWYLEDEIKRLEGQV